MADCKKCIHYDICIFTEKDADCMHFKDKEKVVDLPCKVGQTVYCIRYDKARKPFVKPLGILSITAYGKGYFTIFTTKEDTWGITAFATAEEAEKALQRS